MPETLGVLGGGQLGRYFVLAARAHGFRTVVLEPDPDSPAGKEADEHIVANYDDETALERMAAACTAVTVEFENPPVVALDFLARRVVVRPSPDAVAIAQDRRREKQLCRMLGLATAPWCAIATNSDIERTLAEGLDDSLTSTTDGFIVKTARLGYDGKGQVRIDDLGDLRHAWNELRRVECIVEARVPLDAELSVVLARDAEGTTATYAPTLNMHSNGILDTSVAPIDGLPNMCEVVPNDIRSLATATSVRIADHLSYVGVLAVEFFVSSGRLLVNELAPRPHNSGHWTLDAAATSQFDQQVRTLAGLPLGDTSMTSAMVAMGNLLGDRWANGVPRFSLAEEDARARLHLYGKHEPRPGRKMGHLTVLGETVDADVVRTMRELRDNMTINDGSDALP